MRQPFLTARWRFLAMLNYEIDPNILQPLLPAGTELDQFAGKTYVSLVGFHFCDTRVLGIPVPFHRNFEEVNLRFYVRRTVGQEVRRGVTFIKEIVPRRAIAAVARYLYNENYHYLPMRHLHEMSQMDPARPDRVSYAWKLGRRWHELSATPDGDAFVPKTGSHEQFICEHYWGYSRQKNGTTMEYRVEHPPWRVWQVSQVKLDCDAARVYGEQFAHALNASPASAFLAEGSEVAVYKGQMT